jgi:hypothetical protein
MRRRRVDRFDQPRRCAAAAGLVFKRSNENSTSCAVIGLLSEKRGRDGRSPGERRIDAIERDQAVRVMSCERHQA